MDVTAQNRVWRLKSRPIGIDFEAAIALETEAIPSPGDGQILVKNTILSMDSGTRMWMSPREDSYSPPTPLNSPIIGTVVGEVMESRHPDFAAGDMVRCYGQWADVSLVDPREVYAAKVDGAEADPAEYVGILGANGWTAYLGVLEYGAARAGDTVLISAAAGCTGSMAGQIAKIAGCRVVGLAGSDAKCAYLTDELGFDAAINYKNGDLEAAIRETCPEGINLYFDNVGGDVLDAAMANMALFGRIAVCGLLANYGAEAPVPGPYKFDQVLMKRLTITGFFSPDFYVRGPEINPILTRWRDSGALKLRDRADRWIGKRRRGLHAIVYGGQYRQSRRAHLTRSRTWRSVVRSTDNAVYN